MNTNNSFGRIQELDIVKFLAVFFVVLGHCLSYLKGSNGYNPLWGWIYTFHMPLFMFISGLFVEKSIRNKSSKQFILDKINRLLIPCFIWILIIWLSRILLWGESSLGQLKYLLIGELWFFKSLFACYIISFVTFKLPWNRLFCVLCSIIVAAFLLKWNISTMYLCFLSGMMFRKYERILLEYAKPIIIIGGVVFMVISIYLSLHSEFWDIVSASFLHANNSIQKITILLYRYLICFTGILCSVVVVLFCYVIHDTGINAIINNSIICEFGQYTLGVYVIQTLVVENILPHYFQLPVMNYSHYLLISSISFALISIVLTIVFAAAVKLICENQTLLARWLFGEFKRRSELLDIAAAKASNHYYNETTSD